MNFLRMLVPAVLCVLLFNLADSKNGKVTNKKNIKPQDKSKKLELKNHESSHTHKEDAISSGENIAQRTKESIDAKKNASRNDRNGGHKSKAEHKSLDNDTREKQTGQSKTKQRDDVRGKTRAVSSGKKIAKRKDKAKNKKENLKNRNDKDNVKNHKKNDSQRKKANNKNNKSKSDEKPGNATVSANKTELQRAIPTNCNDIVDQYTNGKILMFEYKIKMKRCMAKKDVINKNASTKSSIATGADAFPAKASTPSEDNYGFNKNSDFGEGTSMPGRMDTQGNTDSEYSTNTATGSNMRSTETSFNSDADTDFNYEHAHSSNTAGGSNWHDIRPSNSDTDFNYEHAHSSNTAGGSNWHEIRPSNSDTDFNYEHAQSSKTAGVSSMRDTGSSFQSDNNVNFRHAQTPNAATGSEIQELEPSIDPDDVNFQNTDGGSHSQSFDHALDADTGVGSDHSRLSNSQSNGQGIDPAFDTHSMETIDQDPFTDTNEKFEDTKRTQLPAIPSASASSNQPWQPAQTPFQQVQPLVQQGPAANFLPTQDQQLASQPQVSTAQQAPATLNSYSALPGPDSFPQTQSLQNANPFAARSEVPNPVSAPAAPTMDDSTQAQAVLDQWRSNSFGASASKKSEVSGAQIAQFLNSQQPSTSQGLSAQPLATQERNQIQPQPFQQQTNILPQSIEQRSSIQPQPQPAQLQPQQAAFNQSPAGPEANLPF